MKKKYSKSLFIFHRDLRIEDNSGLLQACAQSESVIPCFIFDPAQVDAENKYRSANAIQFMIESLEDLEEQLAKLNGKLYIFYGHTLDVIIKLIKHENIDALFCNRDYTPFSIARDKQLQEICTKSRIAFESCNDLLLNEPEDINSGNGTPYSIFTAFFKNASKKTVTEPKKLPAASFYTKKISEAHDATIYKKILKERNEIIACHGGTHEGQKILTHLTDQENYTKERDFPALDSTTHLSAHLKFGTLSVRQVYQAIAERLGKNHPLARQLYWRDFFTHVAFHNSYVFGNAYHKKYNSLPWKNNTKNFDAWCQGKTGFPIVDAGMRELNATGFMHNRVRMIVASFLTKDLHIDWRWGEKYFAQQLVDYDPAVNNGNWQWCASTGCDAQPYFRIFNPWLQQKKFDPDCVYIKKWVPELKSLPPKEIHALFKPKSVSIKNYPAPMVDHSQEAAIAKKLYKNI
jgi:deoxyribodipyrimidine photo-lyase